MKTIEHAHTLVYYDGVQVFAGRDADGADYIGTMIDTTDGADRYLVTSVSRSRLREFYAGELDLRTLLLESSTEGWYTALVSDDFGQPMPLERQQGSLLAMDYLPEAGFRLRGAPIDELMTDDLEVSPNDHLLMEGRKTDKHSGSTYRRKLIEVDLPLDAINSESAREKSIRHGHPSTLHLWWARRPLAACRAVIFASLVDDPEDCPEFRTEDEQRAERQRLHELIKRLVKWESSSEGNLLAEARYEIARSVARANGETAPTEPGDVLEYLNRQAKPIYDPFCGGGSIPLEAQRLGLRAVGSDLNPVAVLITKALIELPPKFANQPPINPDADPMGLTVGKGKKAQKVPWHGAAGLADDVRHYGRKMREMAWERIGHLYPKAKLPNGGEATVIAWLWARTVLCPNPACGVAMPLMRTFQLSTKKGNQHWIKPTTNYPNRTISFTVQDHDGDVPNAGTAGEKGAICVSCGSPVPLTEVRRQAQEGNLGAQMTAIVAEGHRKRLFLSPTEEHIQSPADAEPAWKPSGNLPETALGFSVQGYGFTEWSKLFSKRQLTALSTFSDLLPEIVAMATDDGADEDYADAIRTYIALAIGRLVNAGSTFARWQGSGDFVAGPFDMATLSMLWDFAESNPFCTATQNWVAQVEWVAKVLERLPGDVNGGVSHQADASTTVHAESGPVIVTDPPYYANAGYADLSDFFYIWLRPLLRDTYPDLFAGIRTPKDEEMIAAPKFENADERFEMLMSKTLHLIRQRCSPEFPSSIFYAYKQQEQERDGVASTGWEMMLTALINAGFQIVGTWPMRTERSGRSRQNSSNALASSVILVCRPRPENAPIAGRSDFITTLGREMPAKLDQLTREAHIAPVDLRQAAIGLGMAVYSQYQNVETLAGETVGVRQALMAVNDTVDAYLREQAGELDPESRFCLDWLRAYPSGKGDYGTADTLARAYDLTIDDRLERTHQLLDASQGQVSLLGIDAYDAERRYPPGQEDVTAWESCLRMAYQMQTGEDRAGIAGCVPIAQRAGDRLDSVERLARILYDHYNSRDDSQRAVAFNNVVTAWSEILREMNRPETRRLVGEVALL